MERVIKASKQTMYGVEKGCPTHWTLLCLMLELLILKAKYCWSDCSFNDLLRLLSWVLPQPNSVPAITYQVKKVINPLTMGVEKIHACPNHCILFMAIRSSHEIHVLGVGLVGTRTMTFTMGKKPPQGTRGRKVGKRWYKIFNTKRTLH